MRSSNIASKINLYTIIAVYFLILVGGIVRSMGAGMGCPDWPKCFGSYIPPTDESALPANYEEVYVESRVKKNQRLSLVLSGLGFEELSQQVASDPTIRNSTSFDVQKAWVEYINRLVGVLIGFLVILNMYFSFRYWREQRLVTVLGIGSFILVVFQGWVGSLVVSTNLLPGFISFHMLLALLLVVLLLWQRHHMSKRSGEQVVGRGPLLALLILFVVQIVLGIQVREEIDMIKHTALGRDEWISRLGVYFYIHRSYSLLLTGLIGYLWYINYKNGIYSQWLVILCATVIVEILLGVVMAYFAVPAFAQPAHLLLATVAFGAIFYLFLNTKVNHQTKHAVH